MEDSYHPRRSNIPLASLSSHVSRYFSLRLEGHSSEQELSSARKMSDYFIKVRRGRNILAEWETKGIPLGKHTVNDLMAQAEIKYRLGGWEESAISRIENILGKIEEDYGKLEEDDVKFARDFFLSLAKEALKNTIYCHDLLGSRE